MNYWYTVYEHLREKVNQTKRDMLYIAIAGMSLGFVGGMTIERYRWERELDEVLIPKVKAEVKALGDEFVSIKSGLDARIEGCNKKLQTTQKELSDAYKEIETYQGKKAPYEQIPRTKSK